jgi:hypothetical protein
MTLPNATWLLLRSLERFDASRCAGYKIAQCFKSTRLQH